MGQIVKNINGTADNKCSCDSWLDHWEAYNPAQQKINKCVVKKCDNKAKHGAHVQKKGNNNSWFIAPFCIDHNSSTERNEELELKDKASLANANKSETCGKDKKVRKYIKKALREGLKNIQPYSEYTNKNK